MFLMSLVMNGHQIDLLAGLPSFRPADAWLTAAADRFDEVQLGLAIDRS
jgi:hypothetical protein